MTAPSTAERPLPVVVHWLPALAVMALIWVLSSFELPMIPLKYVPFRDKGVHMFAYAVLGFAVAHAAKRTWPTQHPLRVGLLAVWITFGWGALDELHQAFVPGRFADFMDLVADGVGAVLGTVVRHAVSPIARRVIPRANQS